MMKLTPINFLHKGFFMALLLISCKVQAKIALPAVFSDHMVLQQKTTAAIWGKADPGKDVTLTATWGNKRYAAKAGPDGNWKIMLETPAYGGPYRITISDGESFSLKDVLIGDVWLCSGQSNMEMPLSGWGKIKDYQKEIDEAKYPNIRLLQVEHVTANSPLADAKVANDGWQPCNPQNVAEFSSVAYFFAREIYQKKGIPIGLIHTSWGGTIAEAWTSGTTLNGMPDFAAAVKKVENADPDNSKAKYDSAMESWEKTVLAKDAGYRQEKALWSEPSFDASSWKTMSLPVLWDQSIFPDLDGVVWFRRKVSIPASWAGKAVQVNLGTIDDNDITFFNGQMIGQTQGYERTRSYTIPADQVKGGEFVLAVRVFDRSGGGGIYGVKDVLSIVSAAGDRISLDGNWQYHIGLDLKDITPAPVPGDGPNRPTVLYNAMIHPFIRFAIKGVLWYQGEANADRANQYRQLFPALITDWRKQWNRGDFPFYFVQLANFMKTNDQPIPSAWAELRDAQLQTLSLPNTGMSVTIDIGDGENIHPKNKQEVGRRLALIALAKTYGDKNVYSGPSILSSQITDQSVSLSFNHTEGGLKARDGGAVTGFAIAGADQKFHWANAVIQKGKIVVSSPEVPHPVAVRYAWANNPVCNLINGAELPASPFRTDNWQDSTFGKK